MRNVTSEQIIANFEELIAEDQIQTAVELLVAAEPDDQAFLIEQTSAPLLDDLLQDIQTYFMTHVFPRLGRVRTVDQAIALLRVATQ